MKVFKFGGASVKNASGVKNLAKIVKLYNEPIVIVVSAMGKMTNALEKLVKFYFEDSSVDQVFSEIRKYHDSILIDLFPNENEAFSAIGSIFNKLLVKLESEPSSNYNFEYDQIVSYGELISTTIINYFLNSEGINSEWIDIRRILKTDENYREANVDFELSKRNAENIFHLNGNKVYVTQGFISSNQNNLTTTLGREGSDYTAALIAAFIEADSVTVWKDVPGILNADPKWFNDTVKLDKLKYTDAIELAFYGASVLHPKTIQPVKHKNIPLHVRSFIHPNDEGTVIGNMEYDKLIPSFIFKVNQVLINVHSFDLSFIAENNLERIFSILSKYSLKVNLMQNTAVSFRICVNSDETRIPHVIDELSKNYKITSEKKLELITIRYYDQATIERVLIDKEVILEQHNDKTIQMVVRNKL